MLNCNGSYRFDVSSGTLLQLFDLQHTVARTFVSSAESQNMSDTDIMTIVSFLLLVLLVLMAPPGPGTPLQSPVRLQ